MMHNPIATSLRPSVVVAVPAAARLAAPDATH